MHLSLIVEAPNDRIENATEVQWLQGPSSFPKAWEALTLANRSRSAPTSPGLSGYSGIRTAPGDSGIAGGG